MLLDLVFRSIYNHIQKRQALWLREAVTELEAEWVGLLQAKSGKAAVWQGQARSSIANQEPSLSPGSQQAPADGMGVSLSEVRARCESRPAERPGRVGT